MAELSNKETINLFECDSIQVNSDLTAKEVMQEICDNLGIDSNQPHLGILAISACDSNLRLQLTPEHRFSDIKLKMGKMQLNDNSGPIVFKLGRNGFYNIDEEQKIDDLNLLKCLYYEAKSNYKNNIYPLACEQIVELGFIEKQIDNMANKNEDNKLSLDNTVKEICRSLSYKNSIRRYMLKSKMMKCAKKHEHNNTDEDEKSLYRKYLQICRSQPSYGGFVFNGQMERTLKEGIMHLQYYDKNVNISINEKGLHVINMDCPKVQLSISYSELYYGIFKPKNVDHYPCLFVKSSSNLKLHKIFTRQASFIDKALKTFIESH